VQGDVPGTNIGKKARQTTHRVSNRFRAVCVPGTCTWKKQQSSPSPPLYEPLAATSSHLTPFTLLVTGASSKITFYKLPIPSRRASYSS